MTVTLNERSWAIDVITEINLYLAARSWHIKSAGGEHTIRTGTGSLFPDTLIYTDRSRSAILHGWELKMPDTPLTDDAFISNATQKASVLNRNSFLLWNVQSAVLYVKVGDSFQIRKSWPAIDISTRAEVNEKKDLWLSLLHQILTDLNELFTSGTISENSSRNILSISAVIDVILNNVNPTVSRFLLQRLTDATFDARVNTWWLGSAGEYGFEPNIRDTANKYLTLAKVVLTDWVFKIIFANVIKGHFDDARRISNITGNISIDAGLAIIRQISETCNFWNIFSENLGQKFITDNAWHELVELNEFLLFNNTAAVDATMLQGILQDTIVAAKRKAAGQFATPINLSDILTRLTIDDKTKHVLDPCCGTGTIINQAYKLKLEYGVPRGEAIQQVWASDKYSFPIQLATLTLSSPETINNVLNVFNSDVINLNIGQTLNFRSPVDGSQVTKTFPSIDYVVSNLPFIKSKTVADLSPEITEINGYIADETGIRNLSLTGKSDIFVYIPFYLYRILAADGKVGFVLSNAWMGTEYGEKFLKIFQMFYRIEYVVNSGAGRWFNNADVVTTLLIAKKRPVSRRPSQEDITFATIKDKIETIENPAEISTAIISRTSTASVSINIHSREKLTELEQFGLPWSAYFTNLSWLSSVREKLVKANTIFSFIRGERRGWNPLFYPEDGHGIEPTFIKPILKNLRDAPGLVSTASTDAFSCSLSVAELTAQGYTGALSWIRRFETARNGSNKLLPSVLERTGMHWYEMSTDSMADFVANLNFGDSLFISRLSERSFIDQRLIGLSFRSDRGAISRELTHALLNSVLSMFFIEGLGFGRGLGGLDLNKNKFEDSFTILNPELITEAQREQILDAFQPLLNRNRLKLETELSREDRITFDKKVFEIYGISDFYEPVRDSLLNLYNIRKAVTQR